MVSAGRRIVAGLVTAGLLGCGPRAPEPAESTRPDTVTQAQRDSAVARSGLPGARGVGKAQDASAAAAQRAARLDSVQ